MPAERSLNNRHIDHSGRIFTEDIDWKEAGQSGLTPDEQFILTYFSDIESQTIMYMREILNTQAGQESEVISFLTIWNYEEFYHGRALAQLLEACGHPLGGKRINEVRERSRLSEWWLALGATLFAQFFQKSFVALYMAWGAVNEMTTLCGYEEIQARTKNPILKVLCDRIAKQERRHFAWYFNNASERLGRSRGIQRIVGWLLKRSWTPVGVGVKSKKEANQLISLLFPGSKANELAHAVDSRISKLPGLGSLRLVGDYICSLSERDKA